MADNSVMQVQPGDGSLDAAVSAMPDFDDNLIPFAEARDRNMEPRPRYQDGRYAPQAPEKQPQAPAAPDPRVQAEEAAAAARAKADEEAAAAAQVSTPEDEYFELPPEEEGGEPRRIPAAEVFEGYQRSLEMENRIEEMRRTSIPPEEYDRQIDETVQTRNRLMQDLYAYSALLQPQQPNIELLNQSSPNFNPDLYYQQVQMSQQMTQHLNAVRQQMTQQQQAAAYEQEALSKAKKAREQAKLRDVWPEILADPKVARDVRDRAARLYGIDDTVFANTIDHRLYKLMKDALAYQDGKRAHETAVKVVRQKQVPKLVRSSARTGAGAAKAQQIQTSMNRLSRSGSLDDAADVIGGLLT